MRTLFMLTVFVTLYACVQDEGKIDNGSVSDDSGSTTGSTSGGTTGGSSGTPTDPLYGFQWHLNNTGQDVGASDGFELRDFADLDGDGVHESSEDANNNGILDMGEDIDGDGILDEDEPTIVVDMDVHSVHNDGAGTLGTGVKVVVSDSGVDYSHPDLADNQLTGLHRNYSFVDPNRWDNNAEAYPSGNEPHGTMVAAILQAEGWNDIGVRGVAPAAKYAAFKFILSESADDHSTSLLAKEIHQLDGDFDVFNFSYGFNQCYFEGNSFYDGIDGNTTGDDDSYTTTILSAVEAGATTLRLNKGAVYVQSAGNDYLGSYEDKVCLGNTNASGTLTSRHKVVVAAMDADGISASYSTPGAGVWVSGIGGVGQSSTTYIPAIYTADIGDCSSGSSFRSLVFGVSNPFNYGFDRVNNPLCDYTNNMNGTSAAAPMVSGVVALMLEVNPDLTARDVKYILARTARPFDYYPSSPLWLAANDLAHPDGDDYSPWIYDEKWISRTDPGDPLATLYTNAAGIPFSNWYGFGLVSAADALSMAATHVNLAPETISSETSAVLNIAIPDSFVPASGVNNTITATLTETDNITIESIRVRLRTNHTYPGDLGIHLRGPNGDHVSRLIPVNSRIQNPSGEVEFYLATNAFFEETSAGVWTLEIFDGSTEDKDDDPMVTDPGAGDLVGWDITFYGR